MSVLEVALDPAPVLSPPLDADRRARRLGRDLAEHRDALMGIAWGVTKLAVVCCA